jgi:hypothetical protein
MPSAVGPVLPKADVHAASATVIRPQQLAQPLVGVVDDLHRRAIVEGAVGVVAQRHLVEPRLNGIRWTDTVP